MCGAFSIRLNPWEREDIEGSKVPTWKPIFNARPGEWLPVLTEESPKTITSAFWSFVPSWATDPKTKSVINARAEGIATKPYFRSALRKHRCIIPADGFYEWLRRGNVRVPYFFHRKDDKPFSFAGLYDPLLKDRDQIGFAILTTTPNTVVGKVHNRMPVILEDSEAATWLSQSAEVSDLVPLLDPYPANVMETYSVSRRVNYAREKGPEVMERAA